MSAHFYKAMFPKPSTFHTFKPRNIYKTTGGGALEKLGKAAVKTVRKIIKKKIVKRGGNKRPGKKGKKQKKAKKKAKKTSKKSKKKHIRDIFM